MLREAGGDVSTCARQPPRSQDEPMNTPAQLAWNQVWNMDNPERASRMACPIVTTCHHHPACYSHPSCPSSEDIGSKHAYVQGPLSSSTGHLRPFFRSRFLSCKSP